MMYLNKAVTSKEEELGFGKRVKPRQPHMQSSLALLEVLEDKRPEPTEGGWSRGGRGGQRDLEAVGGILVSSSRTAKSIEEF